MGCVLLQIWLTDAHFMLSNMSPLFYLYIVIILLIVYIKCKKFISVVPHSTNVFIYIYIYIYIWLHTHTHIYLLLSTQLCILYIGLILITLMYLNCASNTRNIQVSDQGLVSKDTQWLGSHWGHKNLIGTSLVWKDVSSTVAMWTLRKCFRRKSQENYENSHHISDCVLCGVVF